MTLMENLNFGWDVALSGDGKILAASTIRNDDNSGHVRIFEWKNEEWVQLGDDIDGEAPDD
jgi:hypothetical protein